MTKNLKHCSELPGVMGLPFLGQALPLFKDQELYYHYQTQLYGNYFKSRVMGMNFAFLLSSSANEFVLKENAQLFSSKLGWSYLEPILGEGLILQDGRNHQQTRKILYPAVNGRFIEDVFSLIHKSTKDYLSLNWQTGSQIRLLQEIKALTLYLACKLFLGADSEKDIHFLKVNFLDYVDGLKTILRINSTMTKYGRAMCAKKRLEDYIKEKINYYNNTSNSNQEDNIIHILLRAKSEEGDRLTTNSIISQTLQLLFGAYETVSTVLFWLLVEIYNNEEYKDLLSNEISQNDYNYLNQGRSNKMLTFLEKCLFEVERLYPPLYFIPRGIIQSFNFEGYFFPEGWYVMLSPHITARNPDLFYNSHTFNPFRLNSSRNEDKNKFFAVIPYGAGIHQCLGKELARLEIKIIVSEVLKQFSLNIKPQLSEIQPILSPRSYQDSFTAYVSRL
jgi:retinoid hydroxylase